MRKDIRTSDLYQETERVLRETSQPGTGQICDAAQLHVSSKGKTAVFTGSFAESLDGPLQTRICQIDLTTKNVSILTDGSGTDRLPKYSPDDQHIAFLSDPNRSGDIQLFLINASNGVVHAAPQVDGWVEYFHWSADGKRILLGVAGHGADANVVQGAMSSTQADAETPSWMPSMETGNESYLWRRAWVYELDTDSVWLLSDKDLNVWEASWCGNDAIAAVVSPGPGEEFWYSAKLAILGTSGGSREVYSPTDQLAWLAASPSGEQLAVVEGLSSDRTIVAGDLLLINTTSDVVRHIDTQDIDITYTEWRSENQLLLAGHRGFETVICLLDTQTENLIEIWASHDISISGIYASVSGFNDNGDCVLVTESFLQSPEIAIISRGTYQTVKSLDLGYAAQAAAIGSVEQVSWSASDGLSIQGWLLCPRGDGPYPTIMTVHGGPVWHWRPTFLSRSLLNLLMLVKQGYAVFLPNQRGSSGRGQAFISKVLGDLGGADGEDCLSGLDYLVKHNIADPTRLGVMGKSYGGYMSSWLITQDARFRAAVSVAPMTNYVTEHLLSNISCYVSLFLKDHYSNPDGKYFQRSPIMHAHKVKTPALNICGALDRCTPPEEAMQFHKALLENKVESVILTYPEEGHGVHKLPAVIDYASRISAWFKHHMPV